MIPYKDLNVSRSFPIVTILLLSSNVALFFYQLFLPATELNDFLYRYATIPFEFKIGENMLESQGVPPIATVFTAMFLHAGWLHLIGNMLYLWIFGDNVEDRMGKVRFVIFYLLCGAVATFAQIYSEFDSKIPALGASGAIAGILGAYIRFFPRARIVTLVPVFYFVRPIVLPAWAVLGAWVLLQVLQVQFSPIKGEGGVAYFAHLGGFIAGVLFAPAFVKRIYRRGRKNRR